MKTPRESAIALLVAVAFTTTIARAADPLPSWNDGPAKQSIITFVQKVTKPGSPDFVPVPERIATFDNDGTLWCEKPMPVQREFAYDRQDHLAKLDQGLDEAAAKGWTVVSMKNDWKTAHAAEKK